jgi:hypothetical protein
MGASSEAFCDSRGWYDHRQSQPRTRSRRSQHRRQRRPLEQKPCTNSLHYSYSKSIVYTLDEDGNGTK